MAYFTYIWKVMCVHCNQNNLKADKTKSLDKTNE